MLLCSDVTGGRHGVHRKDFSSSGVAHFLYLLDISYFFKRNENRIWHSSEPGPLETEVEQPS